MKSKKGISPLIATVLLIGFTIVLAALVIRWGGDFFKKTTSETGEQAQNEMLLTGLQLNIKNARATTPLTCAGLQLLIENNKETNIESFLVRVTTAAGTVTGELPSLTGFTSSWLTIDPPITCTGPVTKIEIFPRIKINNEIVTSSKALDTFTDQVGTIGGAVCDNDGICDPGETYTNCLNDCTCGNGVCESTDGNCPADVGTCAHHKCAITTCNNGCQYTDIWGAQDPGYCDRVQPSDCVGDLGEGCFCCGYDCVPFDPAYGYRCQ